jgi:serine protease Do
VIAVVAGLLLLGATPFVARDLMVLPDATAAADHGATVATSALNPAGFPDVAKVVTPAVVNITPGKTLKHRSSRLPFDPEEFFGFPGRPHRPFPRGPYGPEEPRGGGMGSGVIVSSDGYVLTNNHVVEGQSQVTVTLPDKREFTGKVVGQDAKTDLAVVKIEANDLPSVPWGDSTKLRVGDYVLAIGNPFGLTSTVTLGIVSAMGRGHMGITQYEDFIQTDAAINPGNSGGALVNTKGELVGINTAIFSQTGGYQGVGFAVPVSMAKPVYESLVKTGKVIRGYLGVSIQDMTPALAKSFGLKEPKGALVSDVTEDSPADKAGLKQGDVIVAYQGQAIAEPASLQKAVMSTPVGTKVALTVLREGREKELTVTISEQPDTMKLARAGDADGEHALAGIEVQGLDRQTAHELGLGSKVQGVVVVGVEPDSPADHAGLRQGDVIQEINRKPIKSVRDFERAASSMQKSESILLRINRRGSSLFLSVKV